MEQKIVLASTQDDFDKVNCMLEEGWDFNPDIYNGGPIRLNGGIYGAVVYHLVLYTHTEEEAMKKALEVKEPQIVSLISVPLDQVDAKLAEGYEIKDTFSKTVTMIKKEVQTNDG